MIWDDYSLIDPIEELVLLKKLKGGGGSSVIKTVTGSLLHITDALAKPLKKLVVDIEPVQSGSGDPSPENERPITGWTGVDVLQIGKNLFNKSTAKQNYRLSASGDEYGQTGYYCSDFIPVSVGKTYTKNSPVINTYHRLCTYNSSKTFVRKIDDSNAVIIQSGEEYVRFCGEAVEEDTAYLIDGNPTTIPYTFPTEAGTVYGGTLTINEDGSGTLIIVNGGYVFDGSEDFAFHSMNEYRSRIYKATTSKSPTALHMCNVGLYNTTNNNADKITYYYNGYTETNVLIGHNLTGVVYGEDTNTTAKAKVKAYITEHPIQVVFQLTTPITYQLTAQQVLTLLKGENNIWSNANGELELTYIAKAE